MDFFQIEVPGWASLPLRLYNISWFLTQTVHKLHRCCSSPQKKTVWNKNDRKLSSQERVTKKSEHVKKNRPAYHQFIGLSLWHRGVGFPLWTVTIVTIRLHVRGLQTDEKTGGVDFWGGGVCRTVVIVSLMKMMCDVCWASLAPTNVSDVIVIEKGEVNDRWGAGKKRQENLPQSKALKSPTDKDCPYQASVAGGGKEALVRSQGEPVQGRLPGSMTLWNPLPVPDRCWAVGGRSRTHCPQLLCVSFITAHSSLTMKQKRHVVWFQVPGFLWSADQTLESHWPV